MFEYYQQTLVLFMDKFDKVQQLHRLFCSHRFPIPISQLAEKLECSKRTAKTHVDILRDILNAPLCYNSETKGWHYDNNADKFELPGLWLTANELHSFSAILHILNTMDEGLLGKEIDVVHLQLKKLLQARGVNINDFSQCVKYVSTSKRPVVSQHFSLITDALIHTKQLLITYSDYSGKSTQRMISPQKLVHYQENWYLDAWCHKREALRSFMLPRIQKMIKQTDNALPIESDSLLEHYQSSYGIFAGKAKHTAVLIFYPPVTNEVASIEWHPEQKTEWKGSSYQITIPYNDDRELIRDILKYGNNVEVIKPAALKNKIKRIAHSIVGMYQ